MNPDPIPAYFKFDYMTFTGPEEKALYKALEEELAYLHHGLGRGVVTGTHILMRNQMEMYRLLNNSPPSTGASIDDFASVDSGGSSGLLKDTLLNPDYMEELDKMVFVHYWMKDLRSKVYDSVPQIEYKPK